MPLPHSPWEECSFCQDLGLQIVQGIPHSCFKYINHFGSCFFFLNGSVLIKNKNLSLYIYIFSSFLGREADEGCKKPLERLLNIWQERSVYGGEFIQQLKLSMEDSKSPPPKGRHITTCLQLLVFATPSPTWKAAVGAVVAAVVHQPLLTLQSEMMLSDGENLDRARSGQAWFLCSCCHVLTPSLPVWVFGPSCSFRNCPRTEKGTTNFFRIVVD